MAGALVLRKFSVGREPRGESAPLVTIEGRKGGLVAFLFMLLGLEAVSTLIIRERDIRFTAASLFGKLTHMVPMTQVSSAYMGFRKPIEYLILAGVILVFTLPGLIMSYLQPSPRAPLGAQEALVVLLVVCGIAGLCVLAYALKKEMTLSITTTSGLVVGLKFKRSVIEGVPVDIARVESVIRLVHDLVLASTGGIADHKPHSVSDGPPAPSRYGGVRVECPACNRTVTAPAEAVGRVARCPACNQAFTVRRSG